MFSGSDINKLTIPDSVNTIRDGAFESSKIKEIKIPTSVNTIEAGAFLAMKNLSEIVIPTSVTFVGMHAFGDSSNLKIYVEHTSIPLYWTPEWVILIGTQVYWYSETSNTDGQHWRYVDGVPTIWSI